jgi:hypothetical protein
MTAHCLRLAVLILSLCAGIANALDAGAARVDVTPSKLPVLVNGGMTSRLMDRVRTRVSARALVLRQDQTQVALVVVDSCMMSREFLDETKAQIAKKTGIPTNRQLISATHSHTAPASMGCLGTDADPNYIPLLRERLIEAVSQAQQQLRAAVVGLGSTQAPEFTALRQWIRRPDKIELDPFGNPTVRAAMHAGRDWNQAIGESGPEDPQLSLISLRDTQDKPIAVLGNFSMHYFGDKDISADYFGLFCQGLERALDPEGRMVGILSHGCSGDIYRTDYKLPADKRPNPTIEGYTDGLLALAVKAIAKIKHDSTNLLSMAETRLPMTYRVPNLQLLEWSQKIVAQLNGAEPKTPAQIYAREQVLLHAKQRTEVVVQALRIGEIAIATTPTETYAITGLKIKAASPLENCMVIELANGGDGYIPPPAMHQWGGYNTWAARSAGLEVQAEPRIAQAAIALLEKVTGQSRREPQSPQGEAAQTIAALKPLWWWRLDEFEGSLARDSSGNDRHGSLSGGIAYRLEGPSPVAFAGKSADNTALHLVDGTISTQSKALQRPHTLSLWIWNGMPDEARPIAGWILSRGTRHGEDALGEHLGLIGQGPDVGRLTLQAPGLDKPLIGRDKLPRWTWAHVALVRDSHQVTLYLNGNKQGQAALGNSSLNEWHFGSRGDPQSNWEGRLDEIALFDRVLSEEQIAALAAPVKP